MSRLKTTTRAYKAAIQKYITGCLEEDIKHFWTCFDSEFNFDQNKRRHPSLQERVKEYLQGLPSCIHIDFMNCDILAKVKELHGVEELTGKEEDRVLENWFDHIALHLIRLSERSGINVQKLYN